MCASKCLGIVYYCTVGHYFFLTHHPILQTGLSPLAPGQWKSLLKAYGTIYAIVQLLRPFRVAAAVAMSKMSNSFLEETQVQLNCSRGVAIVVQYALGWLAWAVVATSGIALASWCSGVPVWSGCHV